MPRRIRCRVINAPSIPASAVGCWKLQSCKATDEERPFKTTTSGEQLRAPSHPAHTTVQEGRGMLVRDKNILRTYSLLLMFSARHLCIL